HATSLAVLDACRTSYAARGGVTWADLHPKRIGYVPSAWVDPFGTTNTTDAEKAALQFIVGAGATIVEMGVTVGGTDTPPAPQAPAGNIRDQGWWHYIDTHPELAEQ